MLSIKETASEAAWKYWGLRRELFAVMIIPFAAFLAIDIAMIVVDRNNVLPSYLYWACYLIVSCFAAISCHRVLLLGPVSVPKFGVGRLARRELSFIATVCFLGISVKILQFLGNLTVTTLTGIGGSEDGRRSVILTAIAFLPSCYLFARLALMLPSIAIETRIRMPEAWQLSKGNGWRLTFLVVFLPWLLRTLEWGIATVAPGVAVATLANTTLYTLFLPLEIALLSVSYRRLVE